jgi:hypothetical protein
MREKKKWPKRCEGGNPKLDGGLEDESKVV